MPAKRKRDQPIGVGLTAKQMKRRKPINTDLMRDIDPLTENQKKLFEAYADDNIIDFTETNPFGSVGSTTDTTI